MNDKTSLTPDVFRINALGWCSQIEAFIRDKFCSSHRDGIVVSISGGLDSSVTAALCVRAVGKDKVVGMMLPELLGNPEANIYGRLIADHLDIKTVKFNISSILRGLGTADFFLAAISGREFWKAGVNKSLAKRGKSAARQYEEFLKGTLDEGGRKLIAKVNAKQRARLLAEYKFADEHNYLVAGSAHKTEGTVGLFVKFGVDDCADIMPLKNIYRSQTLQLGECLGIPKEILGRSPNPDILPGITDKYIGYFDMDYQKIDMIIWGLEHGMDDESIAAAIGIDSKSVDWIREIVRLSENYHNHDTVPHLE